VDPFEQLRAALADRYTLERELGHGGMATVYLAQDRKHHRRVAIKVLEPELAAALGPERFLREIEIAAGLSHPHILALYDSGETAGSLYYVMPYVEGETLRDRLNRARQLPLEDALRITREVADALSYAHSHDVVHRDIKPENILFQAGHAVVSDFGIARAITAAAGRSLTATGIAIGTPGYMSPEQAAGGPQVDGRSDIYSLGCVLYEMLAGEPPYTGPSAQVVMAKRLADPVPSVRRLRETIPPAIDGAVSKALAKAPADRFVTAAQFAEALTPLSAPAARPRRSARRLLAAIAVTAALGALVVAVLRWRAGVGPVLDPNLIAVAPFDVLDPKLDLWHEGLVDVLSRNLDGAGPLRTVSPTVVVRRWSGRADPASAEELGRRTGARLTVFGNIVGAGLDTVRLSASILDAASGNVVAQVERRDLTARMDRLSDSLTVALLRELGQTRPIAAVRVSSFGSTNLSALREFLRGEHFFRGLALDSALAHYRHAIAADSTFAPALRRIYLVLWWQGHQDSLWVTYAFRAAALNHHLAPRESLLVTIDSLAAAIFGAYWLRASGTVVWHEGQRLYRTLEVATRRYPEDPEIWYELGEARYHFGFGAGGSVTQQQIRQAMDSAIALDSGFAPAIVSHTIECALRSQDVGAARRYTRAYLALGRAADYFPVVAYIEDQLEADRSAAGQGDSILAVMSGEQLWNTFATLAAWPDTAEVGVSLARRLTEPRGVAILGGDSSIAAAWLASMLAYRGHIREALLAIRTGTRFRALFSGWLPEFALLGVVPSDSASTEVARGLQSGEQWTMLALPWWSARKDTLSLFAFLRKADDMEHRAAGRGAAEFWKRDSPSYDWRYSAGAARGYLALARADTGDALNTFLTLPDSLCPFCDDERLITAQLLEAHGRGPEAAGRLDREIKNTTSRTPLRESFWALERARVNERLGNRAKALAGYSFVAAVWMHADPELQPYVAEAHAALKRLGAEPRP
jgi:serine/threonine-protein kinase